MIDLDFCSTNQFGSEVFEKLMESIKSANKFQKSEPHKVWITTSNVYDALSKEFAMKDGQFVIAPQYILPTGVDAMILAENPCTPNRSERRKKQKEERKRNKKNEIYTSAPRVRRLGSPLY